MNNDGLQDIIIINQAARNLLLINQGTFTGGHDDFKVGCYLVHPPFVLR